ncbi:MAG: ferrochelatase [Planctomycetota bacterium]
MSSPNPIGVLLVQLGTPDAPTPKALRRYLREFLGDPRVINLPRPARWLLLNLIILPFRPARSAALYRRIWTDEGSPLLLTSQAQAQGLQELLGDGYQVALGMRYGRPTLKAALGSLVKSRCARLVVLPLFPQYSSATTASVYDACFAELRRNRTVPALSVVPRFYADPGYTTAVAARGREHLGERLQQARVLFSFHGIPQRFVREGDPYEEHCRATALAIAEKLQLPSERWSVAFQSRFGRAPWLTPYTVDEFARLGREQGGLLAVFCPGFVADCLETLDEIGGIGAEQYRAAGGSELSLVPCVNDHPLFLEALAGLVRREGGSGLDGRE